MAELKQCANVTAYKGFVPAVL